MIEGKTGPLAFEQRREEASGGGWWTRVRQRSRVFKSKSPSSCRRAAMDQDSLHVTDHGQDDKQFETSVRHRSEREGQGTGDAAKDDPVQVIPLGSFPFVCDPFDCTAWEFLQWHRHRVARKSNGQRSSLIPLPESVQLKIVIPPGPWLSWSHARSQPGG